MTSRTSTDATPAYRKELLLLVGFAICLTIGVVTVLIPELSAGEELAPTRDRTGAEPTQPGSP